ncbi:MAG: Zn-dependent hydrolase [Pseudomonadota bacterium]
MIDPFATASKDLRVSQERLWDSLMTHATIGARSDGGINREALTLEDKAGRDLFASWCRDLGMDIVIDSLGTMFATYAGHEPELKAVAIGSHLDTQPFGGKFDGVLGVLAGLEVVRTLHDAGERTRRSITIVNWTGEEGSRFVPSMAASGVYAGVFSSQDATAWKDAQDIGFLEALCAIGYDGTEMVGERKFAAFLEAHIEQGPVLEASGATIGVVTGAQAMSFNTVAITGRESHAGTTPMDMRLDPVAAFTRMSAALYDKSEQFSDARFTVGLVRTTPQSHSTIPRSLEFTLDLRHPKAEILAELIATYETLASDERTRGFDVVRTEFGASPELQFDLACVAAVRAASDACGYASQELISGAGHDAVYVARVCPTAMLFVPCKDGISHNPAESIMPNHAAAAANVLLHAAVRLANDPTDT